MFRPAEHERTNQTASLSIADVDALSLSDDVHYRHVGDGRRDAGPSIVAEFNLGAFSFSVLFFFWCTPALQNPLETRFALDGAFETFSTRLLFFDFSPKRSSVGS